MENVIVNKLIIQKYNDPDSCNLIHNFRNHNIWFTFKNKMVWDYISGWQILSEEFITNFENRVNWEMISYDQSLSVDFVTRFKDRVNWETIFWGTNKYRLNESYYKIKNYF